MHPLEIPSKHPSSCWFGFFPEGTEGFLLVGRPELLLISAKGNSKACYGRIKMEKLEQTFIAVEEEFINEIRVKLIFSLAEFKFYNIALF